MADPKPEDDGIRFPPATPLDLGLQREKDLVRTNDLDLFFEEFEVVAYSGVTSFTGDFVKLHGGTLDMIVCSDTPDPERTPMAVSTEEDQAEWEAWIAGRPANLRDWLLATIPRRDVMPRCWRLAGTSGHYLIESFHTEVDQETGDPVPDGGKVTVHVQHVLGPGGRLAEGAIGIGVFGVPITDLVPCGCGDFTEASAILT